jgi:hypothetical protein
MKVLPLVLVGSLAGNIVLLAVLLRPAATPPTPPSAASPARPTPPAATPTHVTAPAHTRAAIPLGEQTVADFRQLEGQLRSAGLDDEVIRRVLGDVIGRHFKARRRALGLEQAPEPGEFWKSPVTSASAGTPEEIAGRRKLEKEQREMIRAIFGADYDVSEETRRRRAHGLPEETATKLHRIFADYREMEDQARDDAKSTSDIRAKLELLGKEKRADIERLLTSEQLVEFDLRMGAGSNLHNRLGSFPVTEAEFRALYAAQKAFESENPSIPPRERNARFEPELQRVLGESRYAELLATNKRGAQQTQAFVELHSFVTNHNLSGAVASEILALESQFKPQLSVIAQNPSLTAEQKATARTEIAAKARQELLRVMGPAAFAAYEKDRAAWLTSSRISPGAPPPNKP